MTSKRRGRYSCPTLAEANPDFLAEWDNKRNSKNQPSDYTIGSDCKVWWRCRTDPKHSWEASPSNRYYGETGCPYCAGRKVDASNCLATTHPDLAAQWHPTKNGELNPTNVVAGSHKAAFWLCEAGHVWKAVVKSRRQGRGCPYCRGYYVTPESSLAALRPDLAGDWHPEKNGTLRPTDVTLGSDAVVWWVCRYGHEWPATVQSRHHLGSNCPKCTRQSSRPEIRCFCELGTIFRDILHREKVEERLEADLLIPSLRVVVQYDGKRYHANKVDKDRANTAAFIKFGYRVVRIRDRSLPKIGTSLQIDEKSDLSVQDIQRLLTLLLSAELTTRHKRAIEKYLAQDQFAADQAYIDLCAVLPGPLPGKSLQDLYPEIAALWDVEQNARLSPAHVTPNSGTKVFWRCERHGAYLGSVRGRVQGKGCKYCARRVVLLEDSLEHLYPHLAREFHPTKNGDKHPLEIAPGSGKKYWWRCIKNPTHVWEATVQSRVSGCNCPVCCNKRITPANSLATLVPEVARQWHYERNFPLRPEEVGNGSHKEVWWQCDVDPSHSWLTSIKNRTRAGSGCPYCAGKKTDPKKSLAAIRPDLAREWHPDLNDRPADSVLPGSGRLAWWRCVNDPSHIWQARIDSRSNGHRKCPSCYP